VDTVHVIHNHNWVSSDTDPSGPSGQCTVGAVYGSGSVKRGLRLSNIFAETATSCAVGLQINKQAFNRHTTPSGCVGSIIDTRIDGIFFDEPFFLHQGGYTTYLGGEASPSSGCTGELSGRIDGFAVAGTVDGRPLASSDFTVPSGTVSGVTVGTAVDPHPLPTYTLYSGRNCDTSQGAVAELGSGFAVSSATQCVRRCHSDWSCDCVVFDTAGSICFKKRGCDPTNFYASTGYDAYVRPAAAEVPATVQVVSG